MKRSIATELASIRKGLDALRAEMRAVAEASPPRDGAAKRQQAARMMGVSVSKLDALVRENKVRTADDAHLIPMAEIRRYCAPKVKRERKPAVGHRARMKHVDAQSDDAIAAAKETIRSRTRSM